jgi:ubiquinone/menaquinone biosynthesis C-methylase UbiE
MCTHYVIMSNEHLRESYRRPYVAAGYDALARAVFAPVGGLEALRDQALDHIGVRPGTRVLELGCGTGGVTRKLLGRGARVTAVDWSEVMLRRARDRAPEARFEVSELTAYAPDRAYDLVVLCFVLHELDPADRARALAVASDALVPGGRLGVVDHALPRRGLVARAASALVHAFEPPSVTAWLRGDVAAELRAAGFAPGTPRSLASGMAVAVVGEPS